MNITLAQLNFTVGDLAGNKAKILAAAKQAVGADLIVFSEMCITGYPPEDLVLKPSFQQAAMQVAKEIAAEAKGLPALLIGGIWAEEGRLYNTAFLIADGWIVHRQYKHHLPNYSVFDEVRVFASGELPKPVTFKDKKLGILVCEDMWHAESLTHLSGVDALLVLNSSPFEMDKRRIRQDHAKAAVEKTGAPLYYVNQVGGQDEIVFDGASFVMDAAGEVVTEFPEWEEKVAADGVFTSPTHTATIYQALVTGLRDYVRKNNFPGVILGMSGGIDSALVAAIAADGLGADKVRAVMMPSRFTSKDSLEDAAECAKRLGITYETLPIEPAFEALDGQLKLEGLAKENIQSRIRGVILMALSNQTGAMVVSTGNKSEMSMGYATLYGDMCGGYAPLKDVYKTTVYALSHWRNQQPATNNQQPIPKRIITKAPTAELRENQTDQDSLPPYPVLDGILKNLIEEERSVLEIVGQGFEEALVRKVEKMLKAAEYKRRQAPPGVKITAKAFGRDRRYPITNKY